MQKNCKKGLKVQSLIFDKRYYNESKAKDWAKSHGYYYSSPDVKDKTIRIRQEEPNKFQKDIFRTIAFRKGIKAVVACPKFEDGGEVWLEGYKFKNYEDMLNTLKSEKSKKIDISDDIQSPEEFGDLLDKYKNKLENLESEYISDGNLVLSHSELYYSADLDDAIDEFDLSQRQIEELKEEFDDERIINIEISQKDGYYDSDLFDGFGELGLHEDIYDYVEKRGRLRKGEYVKVRKSHWSEGEYILLYSNIFQNMLDDLEENVGKHFYKEKTGWSFENEDEDISFYDFIDENYKYIKETLSEIDFYEYAFPIMQDYLDYVKKGEEEEGLQYELKSKVEEEIDYKNENGWNYQEEFLDYIYKYVKDNYSKKNREEVIKDVIEHFDIEEDDVDANVINKFVNQKFEEIDNKTGKLEFKMGGNIKRSSMVSPTKTDINDACINEIISLINREKRIKDWFIDDFNKNLVIIFNEGLLISDISKINYILEKFEICHDIMNPETNLHYDREQKIITIELKTNDFSVGEYADGGIAQDEYEIKNILNSIPEISEENKDVIKNDFIKNGYSNVYQLFAETPESLSIKLKVNATAKNLRQLISSLGYYYSQLISKKMYENSGLLTSQEEVLEEVKEESQEIQQELESKMNDSWREEFERAKKENDLQALDVLYNKVKVALNGVAQSKGESTVKDFEALKKEIEDYAESLKTPKTEKVEVEQDETTRKMIKQFKILEKIKSGNPKAEKQYNILKRILESKNAFEVGGEVLVGGKADSITEYDLAKKYNVSIAEINRRLQKGMKVESEHTTDKKIQKEIALDHIDEMIDYYDRLEIMEKQAKIKKQISFSKKLTQNQIQSVNKYLLSSLKQGDFELNNSGIVFFVDISDDFHKKINNYLKNNIL